MSNVLDIIRGLAQAASNAYDGGELDEEIGLKREAGHPVLDSRVIDGFAVKFAGNKLIVNYQSEMLVKELHPRNRFENEINGRFDDIVKFLKKEYKNITKESCSLTEDGDADIMVQATSRYRTWVQASRQYNIGSLDEAESIRKTSNHSAEALKSYQKQFVDFLSKAADKRPSNDTAGKNPDTPEA
jgi:hypothetical protein